MFSSIIEVVRKVYSMAIYIESFSKINLWDSKSFETNFFNIKVSDTLSDIADGLKTNKYSFDNYYCFNFRSFQEFNFFKSELSYLVKFNDNVPKDFPFYDILYYSDTDRVIGEKHSKKLFNDFRNYYNKISISGTHIMKQYENFMRCFFIAQNKGCVYLENL